MGTSNTPDAGAQKSQKSDAQQPQSKPYGHGSRESDVAAAINAHAGENRARDARAKSKARTVRSSIDGEPATIIGETVDEMRARVARERAEAEPTAFQASLIGRRPGEPRPGMIDNAGASTADVNPAGGATIAPAAATGAGTGANTTGTTGTTGTGR